MSKYANLKTIEPGTTVTIKACGLTITGEVISANNWEYSYLDRGSKEDWYIELRDTNGTYRYWKQGQDGGQLINVNL